ncbi:TolC family protein [Methylobacterium radiodurans]|uniref:Transporter n=1 Tax=Methylobacterium radiodurans TaxID=2202828 RepID=A0A2U8VM19_9HYPH|nr:TolC family protein [Methylobacterium radiodurans]AWN34452.1 transporter [Methylobacterium radiodurans]
MPGRIVTARMGRRVRLAGLAVALLAGPVGAQTLDQAATAALENSFVLRADRARQEGAEARERGAVDAFMPTVSLLGDKPLSSRFTYGPRIEPTQIGIDSTPRAAPRQYGITADLPLFDGFQRLHTLRSAQALTDAGRFTTLSQRQQVLLDAAVAYIAVLRDVRILAAREAQVAAIMRIRDATARQFEVNDATRTDVALTQSRVQEAEASRDRARAELAAARLAFKRATQIEPERMVPPRFPDRLPRDEAAYAELVRAANPGLAAARLDAKSAAFQASATVSAVLPQVNLQVTHSSTFGYSPTLDRITDTTARVIARVPIYQPGAFPKIDEASALARQRGYEVQDQELATLTAARTAFARRVAVADQVRRLTERVAYLRATMRGFEVERGAGFRTVLDELNIRAELADAEVTAAAALTERDALSLQLSAAANLLDVGHGVPADRRFETLASVRDPLTTAALRRGGEAPPVKLAARSGGGRPEAAAPALRGRIDEPARARFGIAPHGRPTGWVAMVP